MRPRRRGATRALILALAAGGCEYGTTAPTVEAPSYSQTGTEGYPSAGEVRTGYVTGLRGYPVAVTFEVQEGLAVWQGDIVLGRADEIARTPDGASPTGIVIDGSGRRWVGGVVPYEIDPTLTNPGRVTDAIALIHASLPGVTLIPRTTETDYLLFVPSTGCSSYIGRIGGMQQVWLAGGCTAVITVHEIFHALGMFHEQSRCDRDTFVEILLANVLAGREHNFDKHCDLATDYGEYAEGSVMHYGALDFTSNGQPTIVSKRGLDHLMGQRSQLGASDVATLNTIYPASGPAISLNPATLAFTLLNEVEPAGGAVAVDAGAGAIVPAYRASGDGAVREEAGTSGPAALAAKALADAASSQTVEMTNAGSSVLNWSASTNRAWLTVSGTSGTLAAAASTTLTVAVNAAGLADGTHTGTVTISGVGASTRTISVTLQVSSVTVLTSGVPLTNVAGATGSLAYYVVTVPEGATDLSVTTSGGTGDVDMYLRQGEPPTMSVWNCRPYVFGNNETCTATPPAAGQYYVMLHGWDTYTGVTLTATVTAPTPVVPAAPTGVAATVASFTSVNVTWTDASDNETHFQVRRRLYSLEGAWGSWELLGSPPSGTEAFLDAGLLSGRTYQYRVGACNGAGCSTYATSPSITMPTLPEPPTGATVTALSGTSVGVTWVDASTNETFFEVRRRAHDGDGVWSAFEIVATPAATATEFTDTGVVPGFTYQYRLRACIPEGCSAFVTTDRVTPLLSPAAPSDAGVAVVDAGTLEITWSDNSSNETRFQVRRRLRGLDGTWGSWQVVGQVGVNATSWLETGHLPERSYRYGVRACDGPNCSAWVLTSVITTPAAAQPPVAPEGLVVTAASATSLNVEWIDASGNETYFEVRRRLYSLENVGGSFELIASPVAGTSAYLDTGLLNGRTYQYRIRACNAAGCSAFVTSGRVDTPVIPAAPPAAAATVVSSTSLLVTWTDGSANETDFQVRRRLRGLDGVWGAWSEVAAPAANAVEFIDTGLLPGRMYSYGVRACNAAGCSAYTPTGPRTTDG